MTDINLYNDETIAKFEKEISNACSCIIKNPVKNLYENIEDNIPVIVHDWFFNAKAE